MAQIQLKLVNHLSSTKAAAKGSDASKSICATFGSCRLYFDSFNKPFRGKHRVYSIFDSPKRCFE